jgi:hypothetical protein
MLRMLHNLITIMNDKLFDHLTELFGKHCGINANWKDCAWLISADSIPNQTNGAHYLIENDDSFAIVMQIIDDDEGLTETMVIFEFSDEMALRQWLKDSKIDPS